MVNFPSDSELDQKFQYQLPSLASKELGLVSEGYYTSYYDFHQIASTLSPSRNYHFVDLGAGVARSKVYLESTFKNIKVTAIENNLERLEIALKTLKKNEMDTSRLLRKDLKNEPLPEADIYFLYFPAGKSLENVLRDLKKKACHYSFEIFAIEAHGELIPRLKKCSFLKLKNYQLETLSERHDSKIYHFESTPPKTQSKNIIDIERLSELSINDDTELLIKDKNIGGSEYLWLGSTKDLEIYSYGIELAYPKRIISLEQIIDITIPTDDIKKYCQLRKESFVCSEKGSIRKIILLPNFVVEWSKVGPLAHASQTLI